MLSVYATNFDLIITYLQIIKHRLVINLSNSVKWRIMGKNGVNLMFDYESKKIKKMEIIFLKTNKKKT